MTPEEWTTGRLNDLAAQVRMVASLTTMVATHDAKIDGQADDIVALREAQREAVAEFRRVLRDFDTSCNQKVERLENAIASQGKKIDEQAQARQWSPAAKATLIAACAGPFVAAVLAVLLNGAG